ERNREQATASVEPRLDASDEALAVKHGEDVIAMPSFLYRSVDLPDVVEREELAQQAPVPNERVERREEHDGAARRSGVDQLRLFGEQITCAANAFHDDGDERTFRDELVDDRLALCSA